MTISVVGGERGLCRAGEATGDACEPSWAVGWRGLLPIYLTSLVLPIDDALVLPSLWDFVRELGGDARWYGLIQMAYYVARVVAMPVVGVLVGRMAYGRLLSVLVAVGMVASLLYAAAPSYGGLPSVLVARAVLGLASSSSVASMGYVAEFVPPQRRVAAYAVTFGLQRACGPLAPVLNLLVVRLPVVTLGGGLQLTKYTYVGVLTAVLNGIILMGMLALQEPRRSREQLSVPTPKMREICRTVVRSRAYVSYLISFQNNWSNQVLLWTLPIVTDQLYPSMGIVGNSTLLACGAMVGLLTVWLVPQVTAGMQDRTVLLVTQGILGLVLLPYALVFGCIDYPAGRGPPRWVLYVLFSAYFFPNLAQMPANNAIYTKLVSSRSAGVYMSILEMSKTIARIFSGELVGEAYGVVGHCSIWTLTLAVWVVQFVPFLCSWRYLNVG